MPPLSCDAFADSVRRLGLLEDDEAAALLKELPAEKRDDAQAFAKLLIERGKLTKFQAANIYQGKGAGLTFGDYLVIDRIGAGGMGQVFKATHRRMDRLVALKVMSTASMNNADAVKRFEREVRAAAKLAHPNIVHAYDAGSQDGVHYLVMELVNGPDLSSLLKSQGKLPVKKAADFLAQAARGFAFAHAQGVVHRDIKPGNLLVDTAGTVKILDLGLARVDGFGDDQSKRETELTRTGALMGTVDYMAPEQALHTRHADAKSDVYSLGCTMFRLLTGEPLYPGESTVEKILAHRQSPIPSLRQRRPEVPPALEAIFQRMVAKKPDQRPSMQEVADQLAAIDVGSSAGMSGINLAAAMPPSAAIGPGSSLSGLSLPPHPGLSPETAQAFGFTPPMAQPVSPLPLPPSIPPPSRVGRIPPHPAPTTSAAARPPKKPSQLRSALGAGAATVLVVLTLWFLFGRRPEHELGQLPANGAGEFTSTVDPPRGPSPSAAVTPSPSGPTASKFFAPSPGSTKPTGPAPIEAPSPAASLPTGPAVAPFDAATARAHQAAAAQQLLMPLEWTNPIDMALVVVPAGRCQIGSSPEDIENYIYQALEHPSDRSIPPNAERMRQDIPKHESPKHWVEFPQPFLVGKTEVTVGQFKKFVEATGYVTALERKTGATETWRTPGYAATDDSPVTHVAYLDADAFCRWLTLEEEKSPPGTRPPLDYQLPYEAQWEYACRAGTTTPAYFGDNVLEQVEEYAWMHNVERDNDPMPVGRKQPNAFGLYDMLGNVQELTRDYGRDYSLGPNYTPNNEAAGTLRGGSIAAVPYYASAARRNIGQRAGDGYKFAGFRVVAAPVRTTPAYVILPLGSAPVAVTPTTAATSPSPTAAVTSTAGAPTAAAAGSDLWIFPADGSTPGQTPVQVKTLRYDGKTPLTIEAWVVPQMPPGTSWGDMHQRISHYPIFMLFQNPATRTSFGYGYWMFNDKALDKPSFGHQHDLIPDPAGNSGTVSRSTFAPSQTGNDPHHAVILYEPQPDGQTKVTSWFDGKNRREFTRRLAIDHEAFFQSDGFFSELRVSKVARYRTDEFTPPQRFESDADTVALYHCDEGSGKQLVDSSGNGRHGELNAVGWAAFSTSPGTPAVAVAPTPRSAPPGGTPKFAVSDMPAKVQGKNAGSHLIPNDPDSSHPPLSAMLAQHIRNLTQSNGTQNVGPPSEDAPGTSYREIPSEPGVLIGFHVSFFKYVNTILIQGYQGIYLTTAGKVTGPWHGSSQSQSGYANLHVEAKPGYAVGRIHQKSKRSIDTFSLIYMKLGPHGLDPNDSYESEYYGGDGWDSTHGTWGDGSPIIGLHGKKNDVWCRHLGMITVPNLGLGGVSPSSPAAPPVITARAATRKPVPDAKTLQAAMALVKEVFGEDYAGVLKQPNQKPDLAYKLLKQAETTDDPAQLYALITEAKRLALEAGDVAMLQPALENITNHFDVDTVSTYVDAWDEILRKPRGDTAAQGLHDDALKQFQPAVEQGRLEEAKQYLDFTLNAARKLRNARLTKEATERIAAMTARLQDAEAVRAALRKYKESADDPQANFVIGRYLGIVEGDWARAIPMLLKGNDETFKKAAEKGSPLPTDAAGQSALADAWWDAAQTAKSTQKTDLLTAATYWYFRAQPLLTGLQKARAEKRIDDAAAQLPSVKFPTTPISALTRGTDLGDALPSASGGGAAAAPSAAAPFGALAAGSTVPRVPKGISALPLPTHPSDPVHQHPPLSLLVSQYVEQMLRNNQAGDATTPQQGQGTGPNSAPYRDVQGEGLLIGFDVSYGTITFTATGPTAYIRGLRAHFLSRSQGRVVGPIHGQLSAPITHIEARPGYAVGQIHIVRSLHIHGLLLTYMRITPGGLDVNDAYESPHYGGGPAGEAHGTVGGDGSLIVGIHGYEQPRSQTLYKLGLVTLPPMPK